MRLFALLLIPMLLLAGCIGNPGNGFVVTGLIETEDGEPVEAVTVLISGYGAVTTNASGRWSVTLSREATFTPISEEWIFEPESITVSNAGAVTFVAKEGDPAAISFVSGTVTRSLFTIPFDPPTHVSRYHVKLVISNTGDWPGDVILLFTGDNNTDLGWVEIQVPADTSEFEWSGLIELESEDPGANIFNTLSVRLVGDAVVGSGPFDITIGT